MRQTLLEIPLNKIAIAENYRKTINEKGLKQLAASIATHGVQEPIIVRELVDGSFELVAGQRRYRASELAGMVTIPAIVREIATDEILTLQIIENVQRENVHFMEEADAIRQLRDEQALDAKEIAKLLSKSDAYVYFTLQLTRMSQVAQQICRDNKISKAVAWQIARLPNADLQTQAATDLARPKGKHVGERVARKYLADTFGAKKSPRNHRSVRRVGVDFAGDWKANLLAFDADQFAEFKRIVRGRVAIAVWAEAVAAILQADAAEH